MKIYLFLWPQHIPVQGELVEEYEIWEKWKACVRVFFNRTPQRYTTLCLLPDLWPLRQTSSPTGLHCECQTTFPNPFICARDKSWLRYCLFAPVVTEGFIAFYSAAHICKTSVSAHTWQCCLNVADYKRQRRKLEVSLADSLPLRHSGVCWWYLMNIKFMQMPGIQ